ERAQQIAIQEIRASGNFISRGVPESWLSEPEQVMFRDGEGNLHLCHHLTLPAKAHGMPPVRDFFIDAASGKIVGATSRVYDAMEPAVTTGTGIGLKSNEVKQFPVSAHEGKWRLHDAARDLSISNVELETFSTDDDHNWDRVGTDRPSNQRAEVELYLNFM